MSEPGTRRREGEALDALLSVLGRGLRGCVLRHGMVARSPRMRQLFARLDALGAGGAPVLLVGERGTGKELAARALHAGSPRAGGPFVVVHCDALPETLVDSELFGHASGAFPGAARDRAGRLAAAAGGTLFLDAVDGLPPPVQGRLAGALESGVYRRLGDSRRRPCDVRLVAGCSPGGALRDRLDPAFDRQLATAAVCRLPPLRERLEDLEPLVAYFLARAAARDGIPWELSPESLGLLLRHRWPGNVRELEKVLEHACAVATPPTLHPEQLPADLLYDVTELDLDGAEAGEAAAELRRALLAHGRRRRETADALGVERVELWRRLREAGLVR